MVKHRFLCSLERCENPKHNQAWGAGPWNGEPDRVDFRWHGLQCFVHRNVRRHAQDWEGTGGWCGYVGVPRSSPAFGRHYDALDVSVHGGLTFSGKGHAGHLTIPGRAARWILGFDCGHAFDYLPAMESQLAKLYESPEAQAAAEQLGVPIPKRRPLGEKYWSLPEVIGETKHLAHQLAHLTHHRIRTRKDDGWSDPWRPVGEKGLRRAMATLKKAERIRLASEEK